MTRFIRLSTSVVGAVLMTVACIFLLRSEAVSMTEPPMQAHADQTRTGTTYVVNDTADATDADEGDGVCDSDLSTSGDQCSLRAAIQQANATLGSDTIVLSGGLTYTLSIVPGGDDFASGDLDITDDVVILVTNSVRATVDANHIDRVFHIWQGSTEMSGVVILNGQAVNAGGGILNEGVLTMTNALIATNRANNGGGIYNYGGRLALSHTQILSNEVSVGGGGIHNAEHGVIEAYDSDVGFNYANADGGYGGGIANVGSIDLIRVSVHHNVISSSVLGPIGAGIANYNSGQLTLTLSTLEGNLYSGVAITESAGGGLYNDGKSTTQIVSSSVRQNMATYGGGISNFGIVTISASSLYSNVALQMGGGIANFEQNGVPAQISLVNTTVSGNRSNDNGGGIFNDGTLSISNGTVADNVADADGNGIGDSGGIDIGPRAEEHLSSHVNNSVIALNIDNSPTGHQQITDCSGSLWAEDPIFVKETRGCTITGTAPLVISATDPLLGNLQSNDGPTWSHKPKFGSLLINSGSSGGCKDPLGQPLSIDQRGMPRPQNGRCDLGAVEAPDTTIARVYMPIVKSNQPTKRK